MKPDYAHAFTRAKGPDAAARVFAYALEGVNAVAPSLLTTASVYEVENMRSRRVYTENPEAYPTGNFKRMDRNSYFEIVIEGLQHFSSTTIEEIATVFFDWEKIQSLGFESNMNLPAISNGQVIGTMNLLNVKGHFTAERVAAALEWQPIVTLAFLLLQATGSETASLHLEGQEPQGPRATEG